MEVPGMKGGGGRVGVGEDDNGDGMQCIDHPYRNNPGGICAFCLQEKLGKLVSSSFPLPLHSSSSPSFRSDNIASSSSTSTIRPTYPSSITTTTATATTTSASFVSSSSLSITTKKNDYHSRRTRLPFLLAKKKKNKPSSAASSGSTSTNSNIILKRSKSTATPSRGHSLDDEDFTSPRKRNTFWSFLYHSSKSSSASSSSKKLNSKSFRDCNNNSNNVTATPTTRISKMNVGNGLTTAKLKDKCCSGNSLEEDSPNSHTTASSFERKVSRSRSVGCGSRSFSGDFFERISTGFGDCTLRRVESQREGKHKVASSASSSASGACMKERVRCGGLFSGFMMTSSSSSSSSSSYWVSSSSADDGKPVPLSHSRGKSRGWAFASPMRAFSTKPSSNKRDIIRDANDSNNKNATPNLSAIPSLLSARA